MDVKSGGTFSTEFIWKSFLAGGLAGMVAKSAVAPLDRLKILLQSQSALYRKHGVLDGLAKIIRIEGALSLFQGNGAQMVRIFPYSAIQFTAFEMYKKIFPKFIGENEHVNRFTSGALAGVTAVICTFPLDLVRARLAYQTKNNRRYQGIWHAIVTILKEEGGIRGLYKGINPTIVAMVPYSGTAFYCFETNKKICMKYFPRWTCYEEVRSPDDVMLILNIPAKLVCGGLAGAIGQTVSYPLDVVRRRMQLAKMDPETEKFGKGAISASKLIYQEDGIVRGFFRGLSINYIRAIPTVALSFSTYEVMKQLLHLETGVKFFRS